MGGSVAVTIREPNGTEHRMCRWTNTLPWGINNVKMLAAEPDPEHLADYLKEWQAMRADYLKNKDTGNFEYNMTDCYAPYPLLAPMGYGLVLVDFKTHTLITKQGYAGFNTLAAVTMWGEWATRGKGGALAQQQSLDAVLAGKSGSTTIRLAGWWKAGRVLGVGYYEKGKACERPQMMNAETVEDFLLSLTIDDHIVLDPAPFTVIEATDKPWTEVLEIVKGLGFELTPEEMAEWDEAIKFENEDSE